MPRGGLVGDTLIKMIVTAAERAERPVYFAGTFYVTEDLKELAHNGRQLGLVTQVTTADAPYPTQLRSTFSAWTARFRTGGLDSWRLRPAPEGAEEENTMPASRASSAPTGAGRGPHPLSTGFVRLRRTSPVATFLRPFGANLSTDAELRTGV